MSENHRTLILAGWLATMLVFAPHPLPAADEQPDDALVQMIADLVGDADHDMRALGLQQVREEVPGTAATKKFAQLLPKLSPDAQAGLLEALGDRADTAALEAVLASVTSEHATVRAAALSALGSLGGKAQVPLLAEKAAAGSEEEKAAARRSLIRLRGDDVNAAIESALAGGQAGVRVVLLDVLAARGATQSLPVVLKSAQDSQPAVRRAALGALRFLAGKDNTADVVNLLKHAADGAERRTAELALLTICSRQGEACAPAIIAGLADADAASRVVLLRTLARAGGVRALQAIAARLEDKDEAVRDEAVRMLSAWPTADAIGPLQRCAQGDNLRHRVLAIRGLVRLASPRGDKPADVPMLAAVPLLAKVLKLAKRPEEKRLVLGALGGVATTKSLALAATLLDDPPVADEAGLAAVLIAEKMPPGNKDAVKSTMEKVFQKAPREAIRQRAKKVLEKS